MGHKVQGSGDRCLILILDSLFLTSIFNLAYNMTTCWNILIKQALNSRWCNSRPWEGWNESVEFWDHPDTGKRPPFEFWKKWCDLDRIIYLLDICSGKIPLLLNLYQKSRYCQGHFKMFSDCVCRCWVSTAHVEKGMLWSKSSHICGLIVTPLRQAIKRKNRESRQHSVYSQVQIHYQGILSSDWITPFHSEFCSRDVECLDI